MFHVKKSLLCCVLLSVSLPLLAHPVTWKSGQAIMSKSNQNMTDLMYHYSLNYNWSLGARSLDLRHAQTDRTLNLVESNWLIKRWFGLNHQGNIYALSGLGTSSSQDDNNLIAHLGVQADWETRRWYTFFRTEYFSTHRPTTLSVGRLGIAPYLGNFEALHTWIMIQVIDQWVGDKHTSSVMPVIRWFKDNILLELGHDFKGDTFVAAMWHF